MNNGPAIRKKKNTCIAKQQQQKRETHYQYYFWCGAVGQLLAGLTTLCVCCEEKRNYARGLTRLRARMQNKRCHNSHCTVIRNTVHDSSATASTDVILRKSRRLVCGKRRTTNKPRQLRGGREMKRRLIKVVTM